MYQDVNECLSNDGGSPCGSWQSPTSTRCLNIEGGYLCCQPNKDDQTCIKGNTSTHLSIDLFDFILQTIKRDVWSVADVDRMRSAVWMRHVIVSMDTMVILVWDARMWMSANKSIDVAVSVSYASMSTADMYVATMISAINWWKAAVLQHNHRLLQRWSSLVITVVLIINIDHL
jgi:hypothetical protein